MKPIFCIEYQAADASLRTMLVSHVETSGEAFAYFCEQTEPYHLVINKIWECTPKLIFDHSWAYQYRGDKDGQQSA